MTEQKDLGTVKENKKLKIIFALPDIEDVISLKSSCGCSIPKKDIENKQVIVNFTPDRIPIHLKQQGFYITEKHIIVTYKDGGKNILSFKAKVIS